MKVLIRPTKFLDIAQMKEVNERCLPENYNREFWEYKFHQGKHHCFVAVCGAKLVGYVFGDDDGIISFVIDAQYRKKGLGRQLLYHALNTYTTPARLHVRVSNETAIRLYHSIGFEIEGTDLNYYQINPEDGYVMRWDPTDKLPEVRKLNV